MLHRKLTTFHFLYNHRCFSLPFFSVIEYLEMDNLHEKEMYLSRSSQSCSTLVSVSCGGLVLHHNVVEKQTCKQVHVEEIKHKVSLALQQSAAFSLGHSYSSLVRRRTALILLTYPINC